MRDAPLNLLLSHILGTDNAQRAAAENELERRSREVPGFCASLARYCRTLLCSQSSRSSALVALSVLKRSVTTLDGAVELEQVVSSLFSDLGAIATLPGGGAATTRQWSSTLSTAVRRLIILCASPNAAPPSGEATHNAITAQLLRILDQYPNSDTGGLLSIYSYVWLLRTLFEEPVPDVMQGWCSELLLSCAPLLFEILCSSAASMLAVEFPHTSTSAVDSLEVKARCSLLTLIAQTLASLYEWQFASHGRRHFPADLKEHFLAAYAYLQPFICTPCTHWWSVCVATTSSGESDPSLLQARGACAATVSLVTFEYVSSVLQLSGWYRQCVSAELLQALLQSLEADRELYESSLRGYDDETGNPADSAGWAEWPHAGSSLASCGSGTTEFDWEAVVRRRAIQCWSLFRDAASLPFLKAGFVDVVGDQCGLKYYKLLLAYAVLAPADVLAWVHDPNTFLREEEEREDGVGWTTRNVVARIYADSIITLGPLFLHASLEDLHECLFSNLQDNNERACGSEALSLVCDEGTIFTRWQQRREAALFFTETVVKRRARQLRECGAVDFTPLAMHLWSFDVKNTSTHPALTARALMLLTSILQLTHATLGVSGIGSSTDAASATNPVTVAESFVAVLVADSTHALLLFTGSSKDVVPSSSSCTRLVAVLLCRVLQSALPYCSDVLLSQHFVGWQASLLALLSPEAGLTDEALYNTVEQLAELLKAAHLLREKGSQPGHDSANASAATLLMVDDLPRIVMDCWRRHLSDPSFAEAVLYLLHRVIRDSENGAELLLQELPWVNAVLSGYAQSTVEVCAVPYFLGLLKYLFEHAPDEVANRATNTILSSLCQLLLCTEESAILGASSSCLATLLNRCQAAESVQVRLVEATLEAATSGGSIGGEGNLPSALVSTAQFPDAPRTVYPLSTVIVVLVLRMLDDRRDEALLMDMGNTLVAIMQKSTSFSEAELVHVIKATVRRLSVVRTDTVAQQLLAPLATLMVRHPLALLQTLVEGGVLVETMSRWLPQVEHFSSIRTVFASCDGLLRLLSYLSQTTPLWTLTPEETQQLAQLPVTCRWWLPQEITTSDKGSPKVSRKVKQRGSAAAVRRVILSSLSTRGYVETSLPLYAGVLVSVGRGFLTLLAAPVRALCCASQAADGIETPGSGIRAGGCLSDEDDASDGLFREESTEEGSDAEDTWEEDVDSFSGEETQRGAGQSEAPEANSYSSREAVDRQRLLGRMGAQMLPWMQTYGTEVSSFFTLQEANMLMSFFTTSAAVSASGPVAA